MNSLKNYFSGSPTDPSVEELTQLLREKTRAVDEARERAEKERDEAVAKARADVTRAEQSLRQLEVNSEEGVKEVLAREAAAQATAVEMKVKVAEEKSKTTRYQIGFFSVIALVIVIAALVGMAMVVGMIVFVGAAHKPGGLPPSPPTIQCTRYTFIANFSNGTVTVFCYELKKIVAMISVGEQPVAIAVTPDQKRVGS